MVSYLTQDVHDDGHHSVLPGEALVGHVPGRAPAADEDVAGGRLEGHVLDVGSHPAVGLAKHGLWPQGGGHQVDVLALDAAGGETDDGEAAGLADSATPAHLLAGSPAVEDLGLEPGGEGLHHLHLDQGVLLRTNPLHEDTHTHQNTQLHAGTTSVCLLVV